MGKPAPILADISTGNSTHVHIKITYAEKPSRWGQLAREGHQVVHFKDSAMNKFAAVSIDGEVTYMGVGTERGENETK